MSPLLGSICFADANDNQRLALTTSACCLISSACHNIRGSHRDSLGKLVAEDKVEVIVHNKETHWVYGRKAVHTTNCEDLESALIAERIRCRKVFTTVHCSAESQCVACDRCGVGV